MNQSSYKRDFRDPWNNKKKWNLQVNVNLNVDMEKKGKCVDSNNAPAAKAQMIPNKNCAKIPLKICCEKPNGLHTSNDRMKIACCHQKQKICQKIKKCSQLKANSKKMICDKLANMKKEEENFKNEKCYRVSDFPTVPDNFKPLPEKLPKRNVSEYQDKISRTGKIIIKYKIHNHSNCKNGAKCEHVINSLIRRNKPNK